MTEEEFGKYKEACQLKNDIDYIIFKKNEAENFLKSLEKGDNNIYLLIGEDKGESMNFRQEVYKAATEEFLKKCIKILGEQLASLNKQFEVMPRRIWEELAKEDRLNEIKQAVDIQIVTKTVCRSLDRVLHKSEGPQVG